MPSLNTETYLDPSVIDRTQRGHRAPARSIVVRREDDGGSTLPTAEFTWRGVAVDRRKARAVLFRFAALLEELSAAAGVQWYVSPPSAIQSRGVDQFVGRVSIELFHDGNEASETRNALFVLTEAVEQFSR